MNKLKNSPMKNIIFKVNPEVHQAIKVVAAYEKTSITQILLKMVTSYIDKNYKNLLNELEMQHKIIDKNSLD